MDRILTIANSNELLEYLIDSFNLYEHYDINPDLPKASFRIKKRLSGQYEPMRTKYDAIEISIEDTDPVFAARMANAARDKIDNLASALSKENLGQVLELLRSNIEEREKEVAMLGDSLSIIRKKFGIYDVNVQSELLATMVSGTESRLSAMKGQYEILKKAGGIPKDTLTFIRANIAGLEKKLSELTSPDSKSNFSLHRLNKGIVQFELVSQVYYQSKLQLSYDKDRLKHLDATYNAEISSIHLVESAKPPEIKSKPRRSIILLTTLLITALLGILGVLVIDRYKEVNWRDVLLP